MNLTEIALRRSRFFLVAAIGLALAGVCLLLDFPATEEPTVPVRTATVVAFWPGASAERQERLVAHPLEEHIRELPEVDHIGTALHTGITVLTVDLKGNTPPERLAGVWQRLRVKVSDAAADLPSGVLAPVVDDEYGRVVVRSLALTGSGYSAGELQDWAKKIRERLESVSGVEQIKLYGVREERVYVELSPDKLAAAGTDIGAVAKQLAARNVLSSPGNIDAQGASLALAPTGALPSVAALAAVQILLPNGSFAPLAALGKISQRAVDPPESAVLFNGQPAVVLGVAMTSGINVGSFMNRLNARLAGIGHELPYGMHLDTVTDQSVVVDHQISEVGRVFLETTLIVLAVVILFLGWRSGLITGVIVPVTVLGTLLLMKVFGIELHQVSIAAIIISLGLFVDYAIVIVEDFQRRRESGEDCLQATGNAGKSMAGPLLTSALAIILAFVPLVAAQNSTAEYMRSLGIVVAITLLLSLFLALTLTPILCQNYAVLHTKPSKADLAFRNIRAWYDEQIVFVVDHPRLVVAAMAGLFVVAAGFFTLMPQELLSSSERMALQMPIALPPGSSSRQTYALAQKVSQALSDKRNYPQIVDNAVYVGDGGPRFILTLNPPTPAANRAYAVINLAAGSDLNHSVDDLRRKLALQFPAAAFEPKRFSLGPSDAGKAVFRFVGPDRQALRRAADRLMIALNRDPAMRDINTDAEGPESAIAVDINQTKALAAGVTNAGIADALSAVYGGAAATSLAQGNILVPVVVRASTNERLSPERLAHVPVGETNGAVVRLGDVANIRVADRDSVLTRRDLFPAVEVTARHLTLTAQQIVDRMQGAIAAMALPNDTRVEYGGEIADSVEANAGLRDYLPVALFGMAGLFLWLFGSLRKTAIVLVSIPFVLIGATLGLWITGQPVSFTATCGLLALAGIIVNNAVLLIERIQVERDAGKTLQTAISDAASLRLRPIMMTMLTCVLGLMPLYFFGGGLWRPLAATMIGGLALGTLITLVLVPALYAVLFNTKSGSQS